MELFVGLDVSQELTQLCVIASDGKTVWQAKDAVRRRTTRGNDQVRIGLESGAPMSGGWPS